MLTIPFIPNHPDNMHCANAVFRMVFKHYFNEDLSWAEIDTLTKAQAGKATWTLVAETALARKGLQVTNIEPVDYQALYTEGIAYLSRTLGSETARYYLEQSNIASVIADIPAFLAVVEHQTRRASLTEICGYLEQGCLIGAEINSRILNHRSGFGLHFVLLYDFDGKNLILHDPGLPPLEARRVPVAEFTAAFDFPGANGEVVVMRKK